MKKVFLFTLKDKYQNVLYIPKFCHQRSFINSFLVKINSFLAKMISSYLFTITLKHPVVLLDYLKMDHNFTIGLMVVLAAVLFYDFAIEYSTEGTNILKSFIIFETQNGFGLCGLVCK